MLNIEMFPLLVVGQQLGEAGFLAIQNCRKIWVLGDHEGNKMGVEQLGIYLV